MAQVHLIYASGVYFSSQGMGSLAQIGPDCFWFVSILVYNYWMAEPIERTSAQIVADLDRRGELQADLRDKGRGRARIAMMVLGVLVGIGGTLLAVSLRSDSDPLEVAAPDCTLGLDEEGVCLDKVIGADDPVDLAPLPELGDGLWSEEFDFLDTSVWALEHSTFGDGNDELQCYTPDQVKVENGNLVLTAEARSEQCPGGAVREVTSGMVRSSGKSLSPGQSIQWRVKLTPANEDAQGGLWPALWSSSWAGGGWPMGGEWDGFEVMTAKDQNRVVYSIHYADQSGAHAKSSNEVFGARFSDDWHEFRFDYGLDGVLVWYMDGVETHRVTEAPTSQGYPAPFDQAMTEIKINLALGGRPGALDLEALPATLEIDYIRITEL